MPRTHTAPRTPPASSLRLPLREIRTPQTLPVDRPDPIDGFGTGQGRLVYDGSTAGMTAFITKSWTPKGGVMPPSSRPISISSATDPMAISIAMG
mgnify:CR=1 FL=1